MSIDYERFAFSCVLFLAGLGVGWWSWHNAPTKPPTETHIKCEVSK